MEIRVHFLELDPREFRPRRADSGGGAGAGRPALTFSRVDPPVPELNRFFYCAVGARWYWIDRRGWTYDQWRTHLTHAGEFGAVETWVLSDGGVPAGYVELERRAEGRVEIKYLGLLDAFIGRGLGAHLLTCAVERAIEMGATKVLLDTCSLDHPKALANYQARGFREVRTETRGKVLPATPPGPWEEPAAVESGVSSSADAGARALLRHAVAVVAYRGRKAILGAPPTFPTFSAGSGTRSAGQMLAHVCDLYDWALSLARGAQKWEDTTVEHWDAGCSRFFASLGAFDAYLASDAPLGWSAERILAGPIADSLTHIGQLALLRRLAGSPIRGENYARAEIVAGRVGAEQRGAVREFD